MPVKRFETRRLIVDLAPGSALGKLKSAPKSPLGESIKVIEVITHSVGSFLAHFTFPAVFWKPVDVVLFVRGSYI